MQSITATFGAEFRHAIRGSSPPAFVTRSRRQRAVALTFLVVAGAGAGLALVSGGQPVHAEATDVGACVTAPGHLTTRCPSVATRYGTSTSAADRATDVVASGATTYVTGVSSAGRIATIAYDTAGSQRWTAAASGGAGRYDRALITLSPDSAHVYVALPNGSGVDVVAYDAATGATLWTSAQPSTVPAVGSPQQGSLPIAIEASATTVFVTINNSGLFETDAYSSDGVAGNAVQVWSARGIPVGSITIPAAAALNPAGTAVYVAGRGGTAQVPNWSVVALDAGTGRQLWQVSPAGDGAKAIAVSPDGATVVATGEKGSADEVTLGLRSSDGSQAWAATEHASQAFGMQPMLSGQAVTFSGDGAYAFVGGDVYTFFDQQHFHKQYSVHAYSVADGTAAWGIALPAPDNWGDPDVHLALSSDARTLGVTTRVNGVGGGSDYDFATYGVDPASGSTKWTAPYTGAAGGDDAPAAIAALQQGFVVTGSSEGGSTTADYATQALDAAGLARWMERHDSSTSHFDQLFASTLSPDGTSLFMTGIATGGNDQNGNTVIDALTIAADAHTGGQRWLTRYHPPGGTGSTYAIALSPGGDRVYVVGQSTPRANAPDQLTVLAYDAASGTQDWAVTLAGTQGRGIAVAGDGSVYVVGDANGSAGLSYVVAALDPATGTQRWLTGYTSPVTGTAASSDEPYAIAVSRDGTQVAVTGKAGRSDSGAAAYGTLDLAASDGHIRWSAAFAPTATESDTAASIAFRPDGGAVFVTGDQNNVNQGQHSYATVAYDTAAGTQTWAQSYSNGTTDAATALGVSPDGLTVYVTGSSVNGTGSANEDIATLAYDSSTGAQRWVARYTTAANELGEGLAVSPDGSRVYVAGESQAATSGQYDTVLVTYDTTGSEQWSGRWEDAGASDEAHGLSVSSDGSRIALTSRIAATSGDLDVLALVYSGEAPVSTPTAAPSPSATPSATPSSSASAIPSAIPSPSPSAASTSSPIASPAPSPSPSPSPAPTASQTASPVPSPIATPSASPSPASTPEPSQRPTPASVEPTSPPARRAAGYWLAASDGGVFPFGSAVGRGSAAGTRLNQPIVGLASTPGGDGYWLVAADGGVFPYGDATGYGSTGGIRLNQPVVAVASTPDGRGYWLVAKDGGIFPFGDAVGHGSLGGLRLNQPIVDIVSTPDGGGYWLVAADGGVFPFGDAAGLGSAASVRLTQPVVGMAATPSGRGYWLVAADGGIFPFGDAIGAGSTAGIRLNQAIVGMAAASDGGGYWLVARDGGIFPFGDAQGLGSTASARLNAPVAGMVATVH